MSIAFWKTCAIIQVTSASISMVSSTAIAGAIAFGTNGNGLSSPYRRIIFGLSIVDIVQSVAIVTGPWSNPADTPQALWGIGNIQSCRLNGFLITVGVTGLPMYTVFLCNYYVCKAKKRMSDAQFAAKVEKKILITIIVTNLGLCITALAMNAFNPSPLGTFCTPAAVPTGCRQNPEIFGECDPVIAETARIIGLFSVIIIPTVCIFGIVGYMLILVWHVLLGETLLEGLGVPRKGANRHHNNNSDGGDLFPVQKQVNHENGFKGNLVSHEGAKINSSTQQSDHHVDFDAELQAQTHLTSLRNKAELVANRSASPQTADLDPCERYESIFRLYRKELLIQASCYVIVFCVTFVPLFIFQIILMAGGQPSRASTVLSVLTYPLAGFFNIMVYTRLPVASFRRKHPECSRLQALWLILKAGGEMGEKDDDWDETMAWVLCPCFMKERNQNNIAAGPQSPREEKESISAVQIGLASGCVIPSSDSPLLPDSAVGINGLSQSLDRPEVVGYRSKKDWSYVKGEENESVMNPILDFDSEFEKEFSSTPSRSPEQQSGEGFTSI